MVVTVVIHKGDSILLGQKPAGRGPYPDTWHLPGGGVNLGAETPDQAVVREIHEETGLTVKNLNKVKWDTDVEPNKHGIETDYIFLIYDCDYESGEIRPADDLQHLEWVPVRELHKKTLNRPSVKYFKALGYL